jgi:hypothetical protein
MNKALGSTAKPNLKTYPRPVIADPNGPNFDFRRTSRNPDCPSYLVQASASCNQRAEERSRRAK